MAIKNQENFRFSEHKWLIPTGYGDKKKQFSALLGVRGDNVAEMEGLHKNLGSLISSCSRADYAGRNISDTRFIEDASTRAADLRVKETVLVVTVRNQQSKAQGSFMTPPLRDDFDTTHGSPDMTALADGLKANASLLVRLPGGNEDVPVNVDWVQIRPVVLDQQAAPAAPTTGISASDNEMLIAEQSQHVPA